MEDSPEALSHDCIDPGASAKGDTTTTNKFNPLFSDAIRYLSVVNPDAPTGTGATPPSNSPVLTGEQGENCVEANNPNNTQYGWGGYCNGYIGGTGAEDYKNVLVPISSVGLTGCEGTISVPYLPQGVAEDLKGMEDAYTKAMGHGLGLQSCYRTFAQQQWAYNCYINKNCNGGNLAAKPGTSNHGWGLAVDVTMTQYGGFNSKEYKWLAANAAQWNFKTGTVSTEAWHLQYTGGV